MDEATAATVMRCLAKKPGDRFGSAGEVVAALEAKVAAATTQPRIEAVPVEPGRPGWIGARRVLLALGVVALGVSGAAVLFTFRDRTSAHAAASASPAPVAPGARVAPPAPSSSVKPPPFGACAADVRSECTQGTRAWCDTSDRVIACCETGLVATGTDGVCDCPLGGAGPDAPSTCPKADASAPSGSLGSALQSLRPMLRGCYNAAIDQNQSLAGKMTLSVELAPDGSVYRVRVKEGRMASAQVQLCALSVLRGAQFTPPVGGIGALTVPITFDKWSGPAAADAKGE
jgi:TonB family protein